MTLAGLKAMLKNNNGTSSLEDCKRSGRPENLMTLYRLWNNVWRDNRHIQHRVNPVHVHTTKWNFLWKYGAIREDSSEKVSI